MLNGYSLIQQSSTSGRSQLQDAFDKMIGQVTSGGGISSGDALALESQISNERTQRISADNTIANALGNEITRAMNKEEELDGNVQIALNMTLQDTLDNNPSNLDFRGTSQLMYIDTDLAAIDNQVIPKVQIQDMIQVETDARNTQHDTQQELIEEIGTRSLQQIHTINPYEQLDLHQAKLFVDDIESENTDTRRVANIQYADDLYNLLQGQLQQRTLNIIQEQLGLSSDLDFSTETSNRILAPDIDMNIHKITLRSLESPAEQIQEMEPVPYYLFAQQIDSIQQRIDDFSTEGQVTLQSIQNAQPDNLNMGSRQILVDNIGEGVTPDDRQVMPAIYINNAVGSLQSQLNNQTLNTIYQYNKTGLDMSLDENRILLRSNQNNETIENIPSALEPVSYGYIMPFISNLGNLIQNNAETSLSGDQLLNDRITELQGQLLVQPSNEELPPIQKLLVTENNGIQIYDTLDVDNNLISNVADPVSNQDAVNKQTLENAILTASGDLQGAIDLRAYQEALQDEIDERTTQDGQLLTNIQTRALQSDLDNESQTRLTNDNQLQANIDNKRNISDSYTITETNTAIANDFKSKIRNNAGEQCKLEITGTNQIQITSNSNVIGRIYQPVGQSTNPLGIQTTDKLQLQSDLNSTSVYGGKVIDQNPAVLNTNGLYITSLDHATSNVQNVINLGSTHSAQLYVTSGHLFNGTKYGGLFSDSQLTLASSLNPQSTDSQINLYTQTQSQSIPIQFSSKAGYSATTTIDQNNQFTSKAYVDNLHNTQAQSLANMYSISEIDLRFDERDTAIATKLDATVITDYSTTTQINTALDLKRNITDSYSQTQINDALDLKADITSVDASILSLQDQIDLKADQGTTYTIQQTDDLLISKMGINSSLVSIQASIPIDQDLDLGAFNILTDKITFLDQELVTKLYVDESIANVSGGSSIGLPVGTIIAYMASVSSIEGWLLCNGQSFSAITYPDLALLYPSLSVPDLRNMILKGLPASGRTIGDFQANAMPAHTHTYQDAAFMNGSQTGSFANTTGSGSTDNDNDPMYRTLQNNLTGDPTNINTFLPTGSTGTGSSVLVDNRSCNYYILASGQASGNVGGVEVSSSSNINLGGNYKVVGAINATDAQDYITKSQLDSSVSTINTSLSAKYNSTVQLNNISLANGPISANAQFITNLSTPSSASTFHAINVDYLNQNGYYNSSSSIPKIQFNTTSMQAIMPTSTTFQVKFHNNSLPYIEVANSSKSVSFNADLFQLYNNTTGVQNMKISSDGMWFNRSINLRSSLSQGGDAIMYINADGFSQVKDYSFHLVDSSGNGASFDSRCTFNGTIEANSSTYINGLSYFSNATRTDVIGASISCGQIAGYSMICDGSISATSFDVYVPISDRRSKTNIQYYENTLDDLIDIKFCKFNYCPQKLLQLGYKDIANVDCQKQQIGVIADEVPERYKLSLSNDKFENTTTETYYTINLSAIRQDCLIYLMERNKILEQRCQNYEYRLSTLEALLLPPQ